MVEANEVSALRTEHSVLHFAKIEINIEHSVLDYEIDSVSNFE